MSDRPPKDTDPVPSSKIAPPASRMSTSIFYRLADFQVRRPTALLLLALLLVAGSLALASRLRVKPGFEALLPESRPSVLELDRVKAKTSGVSTIFVVLEGEKRDGLRKAADAIVERVAPIGRPFVGSVESGVHQAMDFLQPRAGLFADRKKLSKLNDDIEERYQYEVGKKSGATLDLEDDYEPPKLDPDEIKSRFGIEDAKTDRYPDGYYQSKDGKTAIVAIRSAILNTDYEKGNEAIQRVKAAVAAADPRQYDPSITIGYAGDLITGISEYRAINNDLTEVGLLGALLIIGVVFLYYLRMRTLFSMVLTILIGVSCTFGLTQLLVGHLNMATGFLFTIIAGNGINPGIIFMARYLETRRDGYSLKTALRVAHRETWLPTLTASCAASAAYASLVVTEFRGFRDFGIIGGFGMVVCWLCTFTFLPPILVIAERFSPLDQSKAGLFGLLPKASAGGTRFGHPFAWLVERAPRALSIVGLIVTVVGTVLTVQWVKNDPMEYNLLNLRSDMSKRADEVRLSKLAEDITGHVGADGMAILVDRIEQVPLLVTELEKRRDKAPKGKKPFRAVHTLQDFVPAEQAKKIPLLANIRDRIERSHKRGFIKKSDYEKISKFLPPKTLRPFAIKDLPDGLARPFTERDGTRGRVVYISPINSEAVDDAHYLFRWANAYRRTELPDKSVVLGSGRAVIYADIWAAMLSDVPKAVIVSLAVTLAVVALAFRMGFSAIASLLALLMGIMWMTGLLGLAGVRLNFLNFIALPITFGIGVDYAVNVMQRYRAEGAGGALTAVRETGGAVVLCSATTTLGYLALVSSVNYGVRSLGLAAVLGEVACLLAAVIVLPAVLVWRDGSTTSAHEDRL